MQQFTFKDVQRTTAFRFHYTKLSSYTEARLLIYKVLVFQNSVVRKIFGPKWEEVTGDWRKLHDEELQDLYWSSDIIRVIKSRGMYCAQHVARVGEMRKANRGFARED
jgi:hypothetical protein